MTSIDKPPSEFWEWLSLQKIAESRLFHKAPPPGGPAVEPPDLEGEAERGFRKTPEKRGAAFGRLKIPSNLQEKCK
jgi:hypothetical protein